MEPKMTRKAPIKLAGFAVKIKNKEYTEAFINFWQEYTIDGRQKRLHSESFLKSHVEYGACFPENPENGEFEYVVGIEVKDKHDIPKDYYVCTIPELYMLFLVRPFR